MYRQNLPLGKMGAGQKAFRHMLTLSYTSRCCPNLIRIARMNCELQQPFVPTVVVESVWESLFV